MYKKSEIDPFVIGAGALATGLGVAAITKKPRMFKHTTRQLHWVTDQPTRLTTDRKTFLDKALGRLLYGKTQFHYVDTAKDLKKLPKKLEGTVYYDINKKYNKKLYPKADVSLNKNLGIINELFQNKIKFSKLKSRGSIPKGEELHKALKKPRSYKQFVTRLSTQKKKYIKPAVEYASATKGHITGADLETLRTKTKTPAELTKRLQAAYKNRRKYVMMDEVEPKLERRVDVIVHKGKVMPVKVHKRWPGIFNDSPVNRRLFEQRVSKEFAKVIRMNPKLKRVTKKDSFAFGIDAMQDTKGKIKFVDVNDQSGFLSPELVLDKTVARNFRRRAMNLPDRSHIVKGVATAGAVGTAGLATN